MSPRLSSFHFSLWLCGWVLALSLVGCGGNTTDSGGGQVALDSGVNGKLVRLSGAVKDIDPVHRRFALCRSQRMAPAGLEQEDIGERPRCVTVEVMEDTAFIGPGAMPIEFAHLAEGEEVEVVGRFQKAGDDGGELHLRAAVVGTH